MQFCRRSRNLHPPHVPTSPAVHPDACRWPFLSESDLADWWSFVASSAQSPRKVMFLTWRCQDAIQTAWEGTRAPLSPSLSSNSWSISRPSRFSRNCHHPRANLSRTLPWWTYASTVCCHTLWKMISSARAASPWEPILWPKHSCFSFISHLLHPCSIQIIAFDS